jgi:hypothetical protein
MKLEIFGITINTSVANPETIKISFKILQMFRACPTAGAGIL